MPPSEPGGVPSVDPPPSVNCDLFPELPHDAAMAASADGARGRRRARSERGIRARLTAHSLTRRADAVKLSLSEACNL
jgi:hypothetical protein